MKFDKYFKYMQMLFFLFLVFVLFVGSAEVFVLAYIVVFIIVTVQTMMTPGRKKSRRYRVMAYTAILVVQITMLEHILYSETVFENMPQFIFRRILGLLLLCLPILVSRYVSSLRYSHYNLPPVGGAVSVGISELLNTADTIKRTAEIISESKKKLCIDNLKTLAHDMTRHNSFHYVNNKSLSEEYFVKARESFSDPKIYIVISKTGSPASEFLSVFTQKQYNHASISFDNKLQTTISYNGGENVYPPGLNMELLEFFAKSQDSKIMVYSLACTAEQKKKMLDKIAKINKEGSAYNILGIFLHKRRHKPNILYCTQFVYNLLDDVGLSYFPKPHGRISPTDLVELDYYRKLQFELEITFG
ncbi:MAG: hypothetical protein FWB96_08755 [Defluviitaleaceae bacterium]|nr:hypothetical protein [Defluviitaleaceae bacterium]MCL2264359.1 hypothetical protein [Defluviitaleaceae bacterium]